MRILSMDEHLTTLKSELQEKVRALTAANNDLTNLLSSADIAVVSLDLALRIKRSTPAAAHVFNVLSSDAGRPMRHIASELVDVDPSAVAREVLDSAVLVEREVVSRDGRHYVLRALPCLAADGSLEGVILTLLKASALKQSERELRAAREEATNELRRMTRLHEATMRSEGSADLPKALQEVLSAALEITGADMGYIQRRENADVLALATHIGFDDAVLAFFARIGADCDGASHAAMTCRQRVVVEDVAESQITRGSLSLPVLSRAGVRAMQSTPLFDRSGTCVGTLATHYRAPHRFEEPERRWLDLIARPAANIIHRRQADTVMSLATGALERRVADHTKWLALMHKVTRAINDAPTSREGLRLALGQICETERWQAGYLYLPDQNDPDTIVPSIGYLRDERLRPFHLVAEQCQFTRGQTLPGRVYADGRPEWLDGRQSLLAQLTVRRTAAEQVGLEAVVVLPIRSGPNVIGVLELFSSEPHEPNVLFANLMNDLGEQIGNVLERERSTADMADLVVREQQSLLHTLHDSLGQTLTGLGMLASGLKQRVTPAGAESAIQIGQLAQQAMEQVRQLSRGLYPLEVAAEGLLRSLHELAGTTETIHRIPVTVQIADPAPINDSRVATQLYRIAQEAVTNAVKHAKASSIRIELRAESGVTHLQVRDDGIGIRPQASRGDGLGLRIMMYRATSIGASLSIEPLSARGTRVTCRLPMSSVSRTLSPAARPSSS